MASEDTSNATGGGEAVEVKKDMSSSSAGESRGDTDREKALNSSQITNSEDAKLVKARIFVGNLPADLRTEKGELYDKFCKHGRILGVSIHNRFAFVQFETEEDAKAAVKVENHSEFRSARLELKMAIEGRQNRSDNKDRQRQRSRSPMDRRDRDRTRDRDDRRRDSRDRRADSRDRYSRNRSPAPYVPSAVEDRFCHPRTYGANDVEIIVIRKQQGQYAEGILKRLSDRKLSANMLFLSETAPLEGAVAEFGRCGTHYVITVMPRHEETRAITINMFEGNDVPKIYRNINVDDGCDVIAGHFRDHFPALLRLRQAEGQGSLFYPPAPAEVTRTLNRVAELSAVPTHSLDAALRYLQEMRDRTAQWEGLSSQASMPMPGQNAYRGGDMDIGKAYGMTDMTGRSSNGVGSAGVGADAAAGDSIRESLLGLLKATSFNLNGSNPGAGLAGAYPGAPAAGAYGGYGAAGPQATVAGLSADPILQKALASLVGTGLLNQAATGPSPSQTPQSQTQNTLNNQNSNIPASYRSAATSQVTEENGGGYNSQSAGGRSSDYSGQSVGGRSADYGSQSVGGRTADYSSQSAGGRTADYGNQSAGGRSSDGYANSQGTDVSSGYGGQSGTASGGYGGQSSGTSGRASYGTGSGMTGGTGSYGSQSAGGGYGAVTGSGASNQTGSAYGSSGSQATGGYSSQQSGGYGLGGGQSITRTITGSSSDRTPQPAAYAMNSSGGYQQPQQQQQQQQGQTGLQRGQATGAYAARR